MVGVDYPDSAVYSSAFQGFTGKFFQLVKFNLSRFKIIYLKYALVVYFKEMVQLNCILFGGFKILGKGGKSFDEFF